MLTFEEVIAEIDAAIRNLRPMRAESALASVVNGQRDAPENLKWRLEAKAAQRRRAPAVGGGK